MDEAGRLGEVRFEAWSKTYLAHILLSLDQLDAAGKLGDSALSWARESGDRPLEVVALRFLGGVLAAEEAGAAGRARDSYSEAIALAEERAYRPETAHCRLALGELYAATGRPAAAQKELSIAIELYRSMDMTYRLPAAESTLMALGPSGAWR